MSGCAGAPDDAAAARGRAVAEQRCGGCHGLGPEAVSADPGAPPFRNMHIDYNAISYQRRLAQGHLGRVSMPPADLDLDGVADIVAYVRSLQRQPTAGMDLARPAHRID